MHIVDPIADIGGIPFGRRVARAGLLSEDHGPRALYEALDETGAVLVPDCTPDDFLRITNAVGRDFLIHPSRVREKTDLHPSIQTVEYGNGALELHCEMGYFPRPVRPGLACFFCAAPASGGGATTLADTETFARRLSPSSRRLFETVRLRYRHRVPASMWEVLERGFSPRRFATSDGEHFHANREETDAGAIIASEYLGPALSTHAGGPPRFLNSILASLDPTNTEARRLIDLSLEDGSVIPDDVHAELRAIAAEVSVPVHWRTGDMVIIDNARILHGRTAFTGPRAVWARFGDDNRTSLETTR